MRTLGFSGVSIGRALCAAVALLAPFAPCVARSAAAAVTLVTKHGDQPESTMYIDGDHIRFDMGDGASEVTSVLMDGASKTMTAISGKEKTYTEITEADMKRVRAQLDALRAQMKNMPPEQRKQLEKMLGSSVDAGQHDWKFDRAGGKKTINGFPCEMYRVLRDGKPAEEDCLLLWSAGVVKKDEFTGLKKIGQTMSDALGVSRNQQQLILIDRYPGLPVSRIPIDDDGTRGPEEQVKSIKQGSLPRSLFEVPKGYTKKALPAMGAPGAGAGHPPH